MARKKFSAEFKAKVALEFMRNEEEPNKGYVEALERKAGQLTMEIDFLKKNLTSYQKKNASK